MNKNLLKLIVACGTACFLACAAPQKTETEKWSERMARSEMKRFPEPWMIEKAKKPRWGDKRKTKIMAAAEELEEEDLIEEQNVCITLTHLGYIKRVPADTYRAQRRGGKESPA